MDLYDLVKGPQGDFGPVQGGVNYNEKWEDEARELAELRRVELGASGSEGDDTAIAGTPFVPEHWFDFRDGEVTVDPVFTTADA